ncbi:MAG: hypothetical protein EVA65_15740 [Oceanococcus sp.]|nr:MAG: hypothetical protein EVA65_15740 [Oceanococcus sp.]
MTVVEFKPKAPKDPHVSGGCVCLGCRHEWVGVWPVGVVTFECPACGLSKGVAKGLCYPGEGELIRECDCGNEFFLIRPQGHMCAACGRYQSYS